MFTVQMTKDEVRFYTIIATERWLTKFGSVDRPNYAQGKANGSLEHELLASVRTIIAEWAVAKATNRTLSVPWYPNYLHPHRGALPEVGNNGEVRTVRTYDSIPIWKKDAGKVLFGCKVTDNEYFSEVEVHGWVIADDVINNPDYEATQIGGWRFPLDKLTPLPEPIHLIENPWN